MVQRLLKISEQAIAFGTEQNSTKMEQNEEVTPVMTALGGKGVLIPRYSSDSPGYVGPLICHIGGNLIQVVQPKLQDEKGNLLVKQMHFDEDHPSVINVYQPEEKHAQMIFDNLGEQSRIDCQKPEYISVDQFAIVEWSNGVIGAINFWSEPCYVSAIQFDGSSKGERIFCMDGVIDNQFITREAAAESLLMTDAQKDKASTYTNC
jgi:hypothetical protein